MGYERKVGKAYARAGLRSCLVAVVGLPLGIALVATVLWVAGGREASADSYRPLLALMVPMVFVLGLFALGALVIVRRNRKLDRAFRHLPVEGRQAGTVTRGWHGEVAGRAFDAWVRKGPTVELYLGCHAATRGGMARSGPMIQNLVRRLARREPLDPVPPQVSGCAVYADDPEWMRRLLAAAGVEAALGRLLAETPRVSPLLSVAPNALHYVRRYGPLSELDGDAVSSWLDDLTVVADAVDALGPSAEGARPTELEEWARLRRGRRILPWVFGCLGLMLVFFWGLILALFYNAHYR